MGDEFVLRIPLGRHHVWRMLLSIVCRYQKESRRLLHFVQALSGVSFDDDPMCA